MVILLGMAALVVVLFAGALVYDWRQRRRHEAYHDIDGAAWTTRKVAEGQGLPNMLDQSNRLSGGG
jgi:hypothetical protein